MKNIKNKIKQIKLLIQNLMYEFHPDFIKYKKSFLNNQEPIRLLEKRLSVDVLNKQYIIKRTKGINFVSPAEGHFYINRREVICDNKGQFFRLMSRERKKCSKLIKNMSLYSAGFFIEFRTDASEIWIEAHYLKHMQLTNMSVKGISGLDVYILNSSNQWDYFCNLEPNGLSSMKIIRNIQFSSTGTKSVRIYLPSYASIRSVYIGFLNKTIIYPHLHNQTKPIIFYGSSITQGCAAAHVGENYVNKLSRKLGLDQINYGFSESAFGEPEIAKMIANFESSGIVIEYDHNANIETLKRTHYNFYRIIREKRKDVPIILVSRLSGGLSITQKEAEHRFEIISRTYSLAKEIGDNRIYLVNGNKLLENENKKLYFADDRHPNSKGMTVICEALADIMRRIDSET